MDLKTFQTWMQNRLTDPKQYKEGAIHTQISDVIRSNGRISPEEHLAIYQRSYIARLRNCMSQQFPALEYALDDDLFRTFTDLFIFDYPSQHYNLGQLGSRFTEFLRSERPDKDSDQQEDWIDFMIELADFEYAVSSLFDQYVKEETSSESVYSFSSSFSLFSFQFPVPRFFKEFKSGQRPDLPYALESYCALTRQNYKIRVVEMPEDEFKLLESLRRIYKENRSEVEFEKYQQLDDWIEQGIVLRAD